MMKVDRLGHTSPRNTCFRIQRHDKWHISFWYLAITFSVENGPGYTHHTIGYSYTTVTKYKRTSKPHGAL